METISDSKTEQRSVEDDHGAGSVVDPSPPSHAGM